MSNRPRDQELADNAAIASSTLSGGLAGGFGSYLLGAKAHEILNRKTADRLQAATSRSHLRTIINNAYGKPRTSSLPIKKALIDMADRAVKARHLAGIASGIVGGIGAGAGIAMLTSKLLSKESSINNVESRVFESMCKYANTNKNSGELSDTQKAIVGISAPAGVAAGYFPVHRAQGKAVRKLLDRIALRKTFGLPISRSSARRYAKVALKTMGKGMLYPTLSGLAAGVALPVAATMAFNAYNKSQSNKK